MLLGLRGVGKTVLLNNIEEMAEAAGHVTSFIEAPEGKPLSELLVPKINQALRKLSISENARATVHQALRALRSFASTFTISYGDASISVDPEVGVADSGEMEADLPELFVRVGEAAKAAGKAWTLLIDEVQYLRCEDLGALIVSLHRVNSKSLPVLFSARGYHRLRHSRVMQNRTRNGSFITLRLARLGRLLRRLQFVSQLRMRVRKLNPQRSKRSLQRPKAILTFCRSGVIRAGISPKDHASG